MPLKGYYDPLPKTDISIVRNAKDVRTQFNSVTFDGEVMYLMPRSHIHGSPRGSTTD